MEIMGLVVGPMMDLDAAPQTFRLQFGQVDVAQQLNGGRGRPGRLESGSNAWWHAPFRGGVTIRYSGINPMECLHSDATPSIYPSV